MGVIYYVENMIYLCMISLVSFVEKTHKSLSYTRERGDRRVIWLQIIIYTFFSICLVERKKEKWVGRDNLRSDALLDLQDLC